MSAKKEQEAGERAADGKRGVRAKRVPECDSPLHNLAGGSNELRHCSNPLLPRSDSARSEIRAAH